VPPELKVKPITREEADRAGIKRWHLERKSWLRIGPSTFAWAAIAGSPLVRLAAAQLRLPPEAVFSGLSAAWLHGLDVEACDPVEVMVPRGCGVSARSGISIRRSLVPSQDAVVVRGLRSTTIARTLADLSARVPLMEAVVHTDSALRLKLTTLKLLNVYGVESKGRRGFAAFRHVISYCEPATESQMESRLRMLLVLRGLPRPVVQQRLYDREGRFLGRLDLYYPEQKLGLEYDGGVHRTSLVEDNRRQNRLLAEGIRLLRFTAGDIYNHPDSVVEQVRHMLAGSRGP
jgi:very-short-patch-repair endonuclease